MPLTRVVIEDVGQSAPVGARWLCEMEVGQAGTFRTAHFRAASFEAILKLVREAYRGEPDPAELAAAREAKVAAAEAEAQADDDARDPAAVAEAAGWDGKPARHMDDGEVVDVEALRAHAEKLGVDVDKRWGAARLQTEIDKAASHSKHKRPVALVPARSGVPVGPPPDEPPPDKAA